MLEPAFPADDALRVDDLCRLQVLDTAPEGRFDRITRLASRTFSVPIALVSLVDTDRQWFKSRHGLGVEQTPRRVSFCAHAILNEGAFVIPDTLADRRFADNPLVTGEPFIRFYAGMPLRGGGGRRVGTLCLIDRQPRTFTAADESALADLAAWAEHELNIYTLEHATGVAREKEERLQAILDNAGDGVVTLSAAGHVLTINPAAAQMFQRSTAALVGTPVMDLVAPGSRPQVIAFMTELAGQPRGVSAHVRREVQCLRADGEAFPAEIVITRMRGTAGGGYTTVVRDVSERKKVETMKNEFIATVSHELRTPLTSVRGSLGLLLGGAAGEIPAKARGLLDIAASNCDRLVRLINDMLDIEKIESGNVRFELSPQALLPLVRQAMASTQAYADPFKVRYVLRPDAVDARVLADADRLTQVVINLLSNAAKFSPAGGEVEVRVDWLPGTVRSLRLGIGDRGPGIPLELRDRMFARFVQADGSDARSKPGTGLGLAISKAIVERLGGRIGFVDRVGGGTEFFVELPALGQPGEVPADPGDVLVCEDDPVIAALVSRLLEQGGLRADIAATAADARRLLASHAYRAMTLDVGLPGEDGLSLLRSLRADPATALLPVVVLSAREAPGGLDATAFGAVDWLAKPIDVPRLMAAVRAAVRGPQAQRPVVLHVEDDADLARVVATMLEDAADTVHAASLARASELLAAQPFALMLLDMQLPDGDASELLAALPPRNAATPVVIFSGTEVAADVAAQVKNALVKSRTSNGQLLALLHRLMGPAPGSPP
jgi:PAS domain S-box-containing protein